jgi:hypothetical protein
MIQAASRLRFLLEALQPIGVVRERGGQNLDRDVAPEPRSVGAIDLTHATGANRSDDLVRTEARPRME